MRWTRTQSQKLKSAVTKFNRMRGVEKRRNPLAGEYLPPKMNFKELEKTLAQGTSRDYRLFLKQLERGSRPGALGIAPGAAFVTKWEMREVELTRRRNYQRMLRQEKKAREKAKRLRGKARKRAEVEAEALKRARVQTKPDVSKMSTEEFNTYVHAIMQTNTEGVLREIQQNDKERYLLALTREYGGGLSKEDELYKLVESLPADIVSNATFYDDLLDVDAVYDEDDDGGKMEAIHGHWIRYLDDIGYEY